MSKENIKKIIRLIIIDIFWEIIYFPIWWYSVGLLGAFKFAIRETKQDWRNRGLSISFRFLFKPMYSQNDFWGRFISFFVRLIVLIFKVFIFLIFVVIYVSIFLIWALLPLIVVRFIYINFKFLT